MRPYDSVNHSYDYRPNWTPVKCTLPTFKSGKEILLEMRLARNFITTAVNEPHQPENRE